MYFIFLLFSILKLSVFRVCGLLLMSHKVCEYVFKYIIKFYWREITTVLLMLDVLLPPVTG